MELDGRLHRAVLDELGARGALIWTAVIIDASPVPCETEGSLSGPNPVDGGRKGSKLHVLSEAQFFELAL